MQTIAFFILIFSCFYYSCSKEQAGKVSIKKEGSSLYGIEEEKTIYSKNERNNQILHDIYAELEKPLISYPVVNQSDTEYKKDGLLYRKSLMIPFTGKVVLRGKDGFLSMRCVYYKGVPHGKMERFHSDARPLMEAVFIRGTLSGTKITWWDNGIIKEEEYWSEQQYQGKSVWDRSGRLIRKESISPGS